MHLASIPFLPDRRRATSFLLAVAAHVLVVLLLLRLAPSPVQPPVEERPPATFSIAPAAEDSPKPAPRPRVAPRAEAKAAAAPAAAAPVTPTVAPVPTVTPPPPLIGGMELFEAADIGKMKGRSGDSDGEATGKGDSVAAYGPGEGSGGQKLYNAEWYREPSRAELAGYLTSGAPPGSWALIACRTIEDFHVDNCRSLGEAPIGSGLARAMRLAAWQFRVRPPRVGGKAMVGAWVRIRFDFDREGGRNGATN
jgi:protein TonB